MLILRYDDHGTEKTHRLKDGMTLVGRLPTCDLVLNDPSVSRHHASLKVADGKVFVQDVGSRFGTHINGEQIIAVQDAVELKPGQTLKLGELSLMLEQNMPENALLTENHQISEGEGTILKPIVPPQKQPVMGADAHLIKLLAEVGRTLVSTQSLPDILNRVVDMAFQALPADRAFLMLRDSSDAALEARVLRQRDGKTPTNATLSRAVVRRAMRERIAILATDATTDPGLSVTDSILRFNIRSFICAPLWSHDEVIGVLYLDSPKRGAFASTDLDTLTALANASAIAIEQARISAQLLEETKRRERLQRYHSPAVERHRARRHGDVLRSGRLHDDVRGADARPVGGAAERVPHAHDGRRLRARGHARQVPRRRAARGVRRAVRSAGSSAQGGRVGARDAEGARGSQYAARPEAADADLDQHGHGAHR
jgi:adenylate cyclase